MRRLILALSGLVVLIVVSTAYGLPAPVTVWEEFSFTDVGVEARGCFPADPDDLALNCFPSRAGNSMFAGPPPWTFVLPPNSKSFIVTDAFLHGDSFDVYDNGAFLGSTPNVATDGLGCGDNPIDCINDPLSSHAVFFLPSGMPPSITIYPNAIADAGAGYFGPVLVVPEPNMLPALCLILGALRTARRRSLRGPTPQRAGN